MQFVTRTYLPAREKASGGYIGIEKSSAKGSEKKPGNQRDSPEAVWFQCFLAYQVKYRTNRIAVSTQDPG